MLVTHNTVLVDCSDSRVGSGPIYIGDIDMSRLTTNVRITVKTVDIYIYVSNPGLLSSSRWPSFISGRVRGSPVVTGHLATAANGPIIPSSADTTSPEVRNTHTDTGNKPLYYGSSFQSNKKRGILQNYLLSQPSQFQLETTCLEYYPLKENIDIITINKEKVM